MKEIRMETVTVTTNVEFMNSGRPYIFILGGSCRDRDSNAAKAGTVTKMANCHSITIWQTHDYISLEGPFVAIPSVIYKKKIKNTVPPLPSEHLRLERW